MKKKIKSTKNKREGELETRNGKGKKRKEKKRRIQRLDRGKGGDRKKGEESR